MNRLKNTTALSYTGRNAALLDVLMDGQTEREATIAAVLNAGSSNTGAAKTRWQQVKDGDADLGFDELSLILQAFDYKRYAVNPARLQGKKRKSAAPLAQQEFYDAVRTNDQDARVIAARLQELYDEAKKKEGFLRRSYNMIADSDPLEKVADGVIAFNDHCTKNGITFDALTKKLVAGEKPKDLLDVIVEWRFFIAAVAGMGMGLGGLNLADVKIQDVPVFAKSIDAFFSYGMPWLGAAFIGLNVFKAFTEHSVKQEWPTLARFAAITGCGFVASFAAVQGMLAMFPAPDFSAVKETKALIDVASFSPMQYMVYIVGGMTAAAGLYKAAKGFKPVDMLGNAALKGADMVNKVFPQFINWVGIPAIATLLSATMYQGGLSQLSTYSHYYATAFGGMAAGTALLLGAFYAMGCRGNDFKELMSAYKEGVSISSSCATLPKEKECLLKMGVREETTNSVLPLAGVFNMYGTSFYLGLTAFYGLAVFGGEPTAWQYAATAFTVWSLTMGAPGIPSSNIGLLQPVMTQTGLSPEQINKVFTMVAPMDRFLDMKQTGMNVLGDMMGAVWKDRKVLAARNARQQAEAPEMTAA